MTIVCQPLTINEITMNALSNLINRLSPSATLAMSQRSAELKAQGVDVINLSVGEPDFNTPDHIKEAAKQAIDDNFSRYSPVPGYPALRQAIADKLKNENNLEYTINQISCANGAKQSVCNVVMALVNEGDEVIVPAPYWVSYPEMVLMANGTPVIVPAGIEQDFKITPEQLEAAITDKTKAIILCSPSNPTGSVYSYDELKALAAVLERHPQVYVIADEIYEHINYVGRHESIAQFPGVHDRVVIINGVSKAYAMTGWRLGYICAPAPLLSEMLKLHQYAIMCAPTASQFAAVEALRVGDPDIAEMSAEYNRRRVYIYEGLREIGLDVIMPEGAFYIYPYIGGFGLSSEEFCERLLREEKCAIVPGTAFGECGEGYARISYAYSVKHIAEALEKIERFVNKLK